MTGYSLITGLYQNFRKHLWKSHESYGIHPKKTGEEKNMRKLTKKSQFWVIRVLVEKKLLNHKACRPAPFPLIHVI